MIRDLLIGLGITLAMAIGVGCLTFGLMLGNSRSETDAATFTAIGASLLTLAICLLLLIAYLRFLR